ncbi:MAG: hypothetical protein ACLGIA_08965 [Actinomycetes bacterium]
MATETPVPSWKELLATGRRRSRLAWLSALLLMGASAQLHLVKAVDVDEAVLAIAAVVWLATQYRAFPVLPTRAAATKAVLVGGGGGSWC